jgi:S1-C subfamily serine protease
MNAIRNFFRNPFVSAVLGGIIVAAVGLLALDAGWVKVEGEDRGTATVPAIAQTRPAVENDGKGLTIGEIYRKSGQAVAFIQATQQAQQELSPFGMPQQGQGVATGSGFVVDQEGHILTNDHVVADSSKIEVKLGDSDTTYKAELVGEDPSTDLALLKIDAPADELHVLEMADSSQVQVGDPVVAIGNPFGLDRTVTSGIVSALQRQIRAPNGVAISNVIQTDAPINPGNSGGPLINADGKVIGINSQIQTGGSQGNVGIGFAVPTNTARDVIAQLKEKGSVDHAYIGIVGVTLSESAAKALNLDVTRGVVVEQVMPDSPADKAGLKAGDTPVTVDGIEFSLGGDIITKVNGEDVTSMDEVVTAVNESDVGDKLKLTVVREGEEREVTLTLAARPDSDEER